MTGWLLPEAPLLVMKLKRENHVTLGNHATSPLYECGIVRILNLMP